jgi:hypothetical protein
MLTMGLLDLAGGYEDGGVEEGAGTVADVHQDEGKDQPLLNPSYNPHHTKIQTFLVSQH